MFLWLYTNSHFYNNISSFPLQTALKQWSTLESNLNWNRIYASDTFINRAVWVNWNESLYRIKHRSVQVILWSHKQLDWYCWVWRERKYPHAHAHACLSDTNRNIQENISSDTGHSIPFVHVDLAPQTSRILHAEQLPSDISPITTLKNLRENKHLCNLWTNISSMALILSTHNITKQPNNLSHVFTYQYLKKKTFFGRLKKVTWHQSVKQAYDTEKRFYCHTTWELWPEDISHHFLSVGDFWICRSQSFSSWMWLQRCFHHPVMWWCAL